MSRNSLKIRHLFDAQNNKYLDKSQRICYYRPIMNNYIKLLSFLKGHYRLFAQAVLLMFFASLFEGIQLPVLVPFIDRILNNKPIIVPSNLPAPVEKIIVYLNDLSPETLFYIFPPVVLTLLILKHVTIFCYKFYMNKVSQQVMLSIRNRIYAKVQHLSIEYFSNKRTGELVSRITHDVNLVENALSYGLIDLLIQPMMIIIYLAIAFTIYPKGTLVFLLVFPVIGYPMNKLGRRLRKYAKGIQEKVADINSMLIETISGIQLVKAYNAEDYEIKRFERENYLYYKLRMSSIKRLLAIAPVTEIFATICGVLILVWFGRLVMQNQLSSGVFILFFGSIMSIISPAKKLGNVHAIIQQAMAANDRIYHVLDAPIKVEEKAGAQEIGELRDGIRFENVSFRYGSEGEDVLSGIDLTINKGEVVAIVGPTGTGKTTLINLIPRFYDPTDGRILIDGADLREATFQSLRRQIGIVTQDSILFNDSVNANIAYSMKNVPQEDIVRAARQAFAHGFVEKMPEGYNTVVGDRGFRLSGGEKQRLAIARAILKNAPILILDEATSQLDSESEKYVQEALDELMKGRTVVAIAHRLSTIQKADKILVLDKGRVVGLGRHAELLETCPLYQRLHGMQFGAA